MQSHAPDFALQYFAMDAESGNAESHLSSMPDDPVGRQFSRRRRTTDEWHNGADLALHRYSQSLRQAVKSLIERLDWNEDPNTAWDVGPIILLYRQALELKLKAVVGEGSRFLPLPTDHITLHKTHSLRWLTQIVCQIIKTVRWEEDFKCEGISGLAEFNGFIAEFEKIEPVQGAILSPIRGKEPGQVPEC